ncbi:MAG: thioredoxin [Erysipelotrichaceae bacterium]|nr:thioredoxin [Erysipelotrichaceae bacterium]
MKVTVFYLENCPYCKKAFRIWEDIRNEEKYKNIELELHEEREEAELANSFDYYYVPCFYYDHKKLHEGAIDEAEMRTMLDQLV